MWPEFLKEVVLQCFNNLLLFALFCDKSGNLDHNHRFLLQNHKAVDQSNVSHILCKISSESDLNNKK